MEAIQPSGNPKQENLIRVAALHWNRVASRIPHGAFYIYPGRARNYRKRSCYNK
jgi:hypothetical protein